MNVHLCVYKTKLLITEHFGWGKLCNEEKVFLNISSYSRSYMKIPLRPGCGRAIIQSGKMQLIFFWEWEVENTIQSLSKNSGHSKEGEMYEESWGWEIWVQFLFFFSEGLVSIEEKNKQNKQKIQTNKKPKQPPQTFQGSRQKKSKDRQRMVTFKKS